MEIIKSIFSGVAIFFLLITIAFFLMSYLEDVANSIKAILGFLLAIILFVIADYLRGREK